MNHLSINLFSANWSELIPDSWRRQGGQDGFWRLYQHDGGGAWVARAGVVYPMQARRLYLIPSGVTFDYGTDGQVGQCYVHFDVLGVPHLLLRTLCREIISLPPTPASESTMQGIAERLQRGMGIGLPEECAIQSVLYAALGWYFSTLPPERLDLGGLLSRNLQPVLPAIEYLEEHLAEPLSTSILAERCCLSTAHFIRRFRRCTGMTPVQYLHAYRAHIAAQHLAFTAQSIEEIAAATGFANRAYFTRIFTRHIGLAPATYRRALSA
jgi:AraC-like DNA-binding protein